MNELGSLYIERNDCGNCYRCVRECPVKAISFSQGSARVMTRRCVACGDCVSKCKDHSVRTRDDIHLARKFIKTYSIKVASVSPAWSCEFPGVSASRFVEALKLLGFTHVSESALGGEAASLAENAYIAEQGASAERRSVLISSRCPAVVDYIEKYKPKLAGSLIPVATPMAAHARMIKNWWGAQARTIHISSCIAAKAEAGKDPELVELALTFNELKKWLRNEGIDFDNISGSDTYYFEPYAAKHALDYPLEDGGARALRRCGSEVPSLARSSLAGIDSLLSHLPEDGSGPVYLDLMACEGGCLKSNGATRRTESLVDLRMGLEKVLSRRRTMDQPYRLPIIDTARRTPQAEAVNTFVAESDTLRALSSLGIENEAQQIDCNGCGFVTCRRFAKALSRGEVSRRLCVHFMQSDMKAKFTTLLDKLSSGVAVVDSGMHIVEANRMLAGMLGSEVELMYDANPGLTGADASVALPFSRFIASMAESGDQNMVRDVQVRERILTVSIHAIQRSKLFLVICRSMHFSQVRNEEIVARTQKVINENLETVQKIAFLLGENASRTEAILNSILQSQSADDKRG